MSESFIITLAVVWHIDINIDINRNQSQTVYMNKTPYHGTEQMQINHKIKFARQNEYCEMTILLVK